VANTDALMCVCMRRCRLDDVAGQFSVDLVTAISNAVCPTLDHQPHSNTTLPCRGNNCFTDYDVLQPVLQPQGQLSSFKGS